MKSIFKATAILSGSSIISIFIGLASAKMLALILRPEGYGYYGLLQSFVSLVTLAAGMGLATGLVRLGAAAASRNDQMTLASLRKGAWLVLSCVGTLTLILLLVFRSTLSRWALGRQDEGWTIVLMGAAIVLGVACNIRVGTLNAHHYVGTLAEYGVANTLLSALVTVGAVFIWHAKGIVPSVIAGAVVSWVLSGYYLRRAVGPLQARPTRKDVFESASALLRFGTPFMASAMLGTGVQMVLPMVVVHLLNIESVGYYKAASAISYGYLGFLVTAMGLDYYPRISAVAHQPQALIKLINDQHRLLMLIAIPIILGMSALVPILTPIVYSNKFGPTVGILEWQLISDIFKFSSWTMSYAILARCKSWIYLLTELLSGITLLTTTRLAVHWFGLQGLGIAALTTYIIYYFIVWAVIRSQVPLVWTASNKKMLIGGVAAALFVRTLRMLPSSGLARFATPVGLVLALAAGIPSLIVIWKEYMAEEKEKKIAAMVSI
jgi:antigen flippase